MDDEDDDMEVYDHDVQRLVIVTQVKELCSFAVLQFIFIYSLISDYQSYFPFIVLVMAIDEESRPLCRFLSCQ